LWFTDTGPTAAIGRTSAAGQITEFSAGLDPGSAPVGIAAGSDGNLWFADGASAIGRIGSGIPDPSPSSPNAFSVGMCKRKHKKALKTKRAHHGLTPSVKNHLKKKLRKCERKAKQLPL